MGRGGVGAGGVASTNGGSYGDRDWPKSQGLLVLLGARGSLGAQRNLNHLPHNAQAQGSLGERHSQVDKASSNCKFYGALCPVPGEDPYKVAHRDQKGVCMRILLFFFEMTKQRDSTPTTFSNSPLHARALGYIK